MSTTPTNGGRFAYAVPTLAEEVADQLASDLREDQTVEGDTTVYAFATEADREAAIDLLFIWYGLGREYDTWQGLTSSETGPERLTVEDARSTVNAGTLRVPNKLRGPFSWKRTGQ